MTSPNEQFASSFLTLLSDSGCLAFLLFCRYISILYIAELHDIAWGYFLNILCYLCCFCWVRYSCRYHILFDPSSYSSGWLLINMYLLLFIEIAFIFIFFQHRVRISISFVSSLLILFLILLSLVLIFQFVFILVIMLFSSLLLCNLKYASFSANHLAFSRNHRFLNVCYSISQFSIHILTSSLTISILLLTLTFIFSSCWKSNLHVVSFFHLSQLSDQHVTSSLLSAFDSVIAPLLLFLL